MMLRVLASEVAHDLATPVLYFRELVKDLGRRDTLESEEATAGQQEVDKLARVQRVLRSHSAMPPVMPVALSLTTPVQRAIDSHARQGSLLAVSLGNLEHGKVHGDAELSAVLLLLLLRALTSWGARSATCAIEQGPKHLELTITHDGAESTSETRCSALSAPCLPWTAARFVGRALQWNVKSVMTVITIEIPRLRDVL